ncbi:MAG: RcpC/CpaB family pilus assembly protein [Thermoleophilia bacterium]
MRGRRGGLWMALAGLAGVIAVVVTLRSGGSSEPTGRVLVAGTALPAGLLLDADAVAEVLVPAPVPADLGLPGLIRDPAEAVGRRVAAPIAAGEPVTQAVLGGAPDSAPRPLAVGERTVAVPLSAAGGTAAGVGAGARVDVVASSGEGLAGRSAIVVSDAEVLAVAQAAPGVDGVAADEALLRVTAAQALRVTAALNFSREVRLLVRPREEVGRGEGPREAAAP